MKKRIGILGSTGSIGKNALIVAKHLKEEIEVTALCAKSNIDLLEAQVLAFSPEVVAVYDEGKAAILQNRLPNIRVLSGIEGLVAIATHPSVDLLLSAISGFDGVLPTLRAIESKKDIALANKEVLVAAGRLVKNLILEHCVECIPVDSEHTALFQCLKGEKTSDVNRIILTASGGPFREYSKQRLEGVGVQEALKHPNFQMGSKVTIDSSTLMNKGLEMIEAHFFYDVPIERIEILVHPQQVIHSMVEYIEGSIIAQIGEPDMLGPIQFALSYPKRLPGILEPFDFTKNPSLTFSSVDTDKFRCLKLAYDAMRVGESMPCFMNAVNEVLVNRFLQREIGWLEISQKLETLMEKHTLEKIKDYEELAIVDIQARQLAETA